MDFRPRFSSYSSVKVKTHSNATITTKLMLSSPRNIAMPCLMNYILDINIDKVQDWIALPINDVTVE